MPLREGRPPQPSFEDSIEREAAKAKDEQVTRYYEELDVNDPANQPTDDETARPSPLTKLPGAFVEPLSKAERDEITAIADAYEKKFVTPAKEKVDDGQV